MGFKAYFAGILTGALCTLSGYLLANNDRIAAADPGGASDGYIMATPPQGPNHQLIYVMKTSPAEDAQLAVYKVSDGGDLTLVSSRRVPYDFKLWNMGSKGMKPEEIKKQIKEDEPK
ncbi:MAG: hypothetical protein HYY18_21160 [Planctomycetes bacterium]|nr:hypothetical protein [Planctomycetota bacterium]